MDVVSPAISPSFRALISLRPEQRVGWGNGAIVGSGRVALTVLNCQRLLDSLVVSAQYPSCWVIRCYHKISLTTIKEH